MNAQPITPGQLHPATDERVRDALATARIATSLIPDAVEALRQAGLIVVVGYYVPSDAELYRDYYRLGEAYLRNRIDVCWVMCAETYRALYQRHHRIHFQILPELSFVEEPDPSRDTSSSGWVMTRGATSTDAGTLFGVPIRIDPAARRPMFEIVERTQ